MLVVVVVLVALVCACICIIWKDFVELPPVVLASGLELLELLELLAFGVGPPTGDGLSRVILL